MCVVEVGVREKEKRNTLQEAAFRVQIIYKKACEIALSHHTHHINDLNRNENFSALQQAAQDFLPPFWVSPHSPLPPPQMTNI